MKNVVTIDGHEINRKTVTGFVEQIFNKKEIKRMITLSKWHRNFDKPDDEYTNKDCDKFIEIWDFQLRAKLFDADKHCELVLDTNAKRPKIMSIDRIFSIKEVI